MPFYYFLRNTTMSKLITIDECKNILQLSGSSYDTTINVLIPIVEDYILNYCNITADSASLQPGLKMSAANLINYQMQQQKNTNVSSEKIGNYSIAYANDYPRNLINSLRPYRKIKFLQSDNTDWLADFIEEFD